MRRAFAMAVATLSLAGCSSVSSGDYLSSFRSPLPPVQVQLESTPPGAEARTSLGPGCKTPCSVSVSPPDGVTSFLAQLFIQRRAAANNKDGVGLLGFRFQFRHGSSSNEFVQFRRFNSLICNRGAFRLAERK